MHCRPVVLAALVLVACACSSGSSSSKSIDTLPVKPPSTSSAPTTARTAITAGTAGDPARARIATTGVAHGLSNPVALAWRAGDARMYVAEQSGRVRIVGTDGTVARTPVVSVAVSHGYEQGLLGLVFSRDGSKLYIHYDDPNGDTNVVEYAMRGDVADPSTRRVVLFTHQPYSNHNGGEVAIGPDGMLYIGLGDGGSERDPHNYGQNLTTLLAKILRIDPNGNPYSVPADNPFVGRRDARAETWMYGLRNPWRFTWDRATGEMWIGDVGQNLYEEVDVARPGERGTNWGWSLREGFHAFKGRQPAGARDPLVETTHADGNCAIVGGYVYRGNAIPALQGVYLFGDNCKSNIYGVTEARPTPHDMGVKVNGLMTFGEDPSGELYAAARDGTVYRFAAD